MQKYVPLTQQKYCCVPACLSMVMYRHNIPLISIEDLGYALGLTVPEEDSWLFSGARNGERPPAGWGTRINEPEFEINKVLRKLNIPLEVLIDKSIASIEDLRSHLHAVQDVNSDALLCFDYGTLWDLDVKNGHVCVFDRIDGDDVWLIDPERNVPKHRKTSLVKLFAAMDFHGAENTCGIWSIQYIL